MRLLAIILTVGMLFSSCDKSTPDAQGEYLLSSGVLVSNEGNFQWGNASVSFYDFENDTLYDAIFEHVNQRPLGDVLQSINVKDDKVYLVLNNSGRIEVVNKNTFELESTILGFLAPRYIHFVDENKAYVSDLYADKIAVVDLNAQQIVSYNTCEGWTEEMIQIGDKVYIANLESDQILKIDTELDVIEDTLQIDFELNSIKKDAQNRIWISGNDNGVGHVLCMDALTGSSLYDYTFEGVVPSDLFVTEDGHDVYFLSEGVWHINEFTDNVVTEPIIPAEGRLFYGLSVNDDIVYIADAVNYVQKGSVWLYDLQQNLIDEWEVGIIPSEFDFIDE